MTTNLGAEISRTQMGFLRSLATRVIRYTLKRERVDVRKVHVSVLFTGDEFIATLNKRYRAVEGPTDVLAFALSEGEDVEDADGIEPDGLLMPKMLGDIVISLDTAARQAEAQGKPLRHELALLLVHGTLHLLGYDHDDPQKEAVMWAKQNAILKALNI